LWIVGIHSESLKRAEVKLRVCSERWFFGRARLLPSRPVLRNWLGRSLALPLQEQTLTDLARK
jgi:hypothetical protein